MGRPHGKRRGGRSAAARLRIDYRCFATSKATAVSQRLALRPSGDQVPTLAESQGTAAFEIEAVSR